MRSGDFSPPKVGRSTEQLSALSDRGVLACAVPRSAAVGRASQGVLRGRQSSASDRARMRRKKSAKQGPALQEKKLSHNRLNMSKVA